MCHDSCSSIHYGLCLSAFDLISCAEAYHLYSQNTTILDLIQLRQKHKLKPIRFTTHKSSSHHATIASLSIELLAMIKKELLLLFLNERNQSYFMDLHEHCLEAFTEAFSIQGRSIKSGELDWDDKQLPRLMDPWNWKEKHWEIHDDDFCEVCPAFHAGDLLVWGDYGEEAWDEPEDTPAKKEKIRRLLRAYGLSLPSFELFGRIESSRQHALHLGFLVALPSFIRSSSNQLTLIKDFEDSSNFHTDNCEEPTFHSAATFLPSFFETTDNEEKKFEKLVKDFPIHPVPLAGVRYSTRNTGEEIKERLNIPIKAEKEKKEIRRKGRKGSWQEEVDRIYASKLRPEWVHIHVSISTAKV